MFRRNTEKFSIRVIEKNSTRKIKADMNTLNYKSVDMQLEVKTQKFNNYLLNNKKHFSFILTCCTN